MAAIGGHQDVVRMLIDAGADVKTQTNVSTNKLYVYEVILSCMNSQWYCWIIIYDKYSKTCEYSL